MADANYRFVVPFVDALAALGLRHACITPGSRNTPLTLAFAAHPAISDWSHHDERSSAFFAIGIARATGAPVVVVTTSGTAAAELLPAAVEARHSRVPLLLLTADRPPESRNVGAPQAIDQVRLLDPAVKWFHDTGPAEGVPDGFAHLLALRAWAEALDPAPGPVHVNFPFREPLVPSGPLLPPPPPTDLRHVPGRVHPPAAAVADLAGTMSGKRTLIVAGPDVRDDALGVLERLAAAGFPVLADVLSPARHGGGAAIPTGDLLARAGMLTDHPPELVVRIGALPTSKPLWTALSRVEAPQVLVDDAGWRDPLPGARTVLRGDPGVTLGAVLEAGLEAAPSGWRDMWHAADRAAAVARDAAVERAGFPSEPGVVAALGRALPEGATLWAGSSMPVRDADTFLPRRPLRVRGNRGANGIDGLISAALGEAATAPAPVYALAGDLSLVYDVSALGTAARLGVPLTVVVADNDGGGIFHFLPQAGFPEHFERHFGTPHRLDLVSVVSGFGVPAQRVTDPASLEKAVAVPPAGPRVVVVPTDRHDNVAVHRRIFQAVTEAVRDAVS